MDKLDMTERRNIPSSTQFLNMHERTLAERLIVSAGNPEHIFVGGPGAERTVLVFLPDYPCEVRPVSYIRAEFADMYELDHRDFLGALMGAGIKRETVGDINVSEHHADIAVLSDIAPYLMSNFDSAGRAKLSLKIIDESELDEKPDDYKPVHATVSSLRLDAVMSAAFNMSRSRASELISAGRVTLDYMECLKGDKPVEAGSVISVRGFGRAVVDTVGGQSRKGRTIVEIKRYGK